MEEALVARLLAAPGVAALVGTRINWRARVQGQALPALTLTVISRQSDYTYEGRDSLQQARVQVEAFGESYAAAKLALRAAVLVMEAPGIEGDVTFQAGFIESQRDDGEHVGSRYVFRCSADVTIWHSEQI